MSIFNEHQHNCPLQNPTLAIGSNDLTAQNSATFLYKIDGEIYGPKSVANFAALTGITIETGYKAVISFYVDAAGATRAEKGEEVPTAGTLSFKNEEIPLYYDGDEALMGFIIVANATGSQFVGGTTQLDAVGVTTTYINNFGWVGM
jgi:hypothetical protein